MKIKDLEVVAKIRMYNNLKRPDIKAYIGMVFGGIFVVNGFTVRVSKNHPEASDMSPEKYWLAKPISGHGFRYFEMLDEDAWKQFEKEVIDEFLNQQIPVVE